MTKDYKQVRYLSDLLRGERVKRNADEIKCTAIAGDGFRNRMKETGDAIEDLVNVGPDTFIGVFFIIQNIPSNTKTVPAIFFFGRLYGFF